MKLFTPEYIRKNWQDKYEWDRGKVINGEMQHYREKNALNSKIVGDVDEGNVLQLTAVREDITIDGVMQQYSSAVFISQGKDYVTTGGYVEARLKLPQGEGLWPAFWLLRRDPVWAKSEIDIMEGVSGVKDGKYHIAHHSHTEEGNTYQKLGTAIPTGTDLVNEYHDYGLYIGEDYIEYYFDGKVVDAVELHEHERDLEWYMLLNLAVAGDGTWAAGDARPFYNWHMANFRCAHITVGQGVPDDTMVIIPEEDMQRVTTASAELMVNMMDGEVFDTIAQGRLSQSSILSRFIYRLARALGGKL